MAAVSASPTAVAMPSPAAYTGLLKSATAPRTVSRNPPVENCAPRPASAVASISPTALFAPIENLATRPVRAVFAATRAIFAGVSTTRMPVSEEPRACATVIVAILGGCGAALYQKHQTSVQQEGRPRGRNPVAVARRLLIGVATACGALALALGGAVSISGLAFRASEAATRDWVRTVPIDRLLTETDAPWLGAALSKVMSRLSVVRP